jgi:hypothetical protein
MGLEGRLSLSVSTLARGSLTFEAYASSGVMNGGELSKYPIILARAFISPTANGTATCHHGA